ncbi:hypothetical protein D3C77_239940 [compost metagenome]
MRLIEKVEMMDDDQAFSIFEAIPAAYTCRARARVFSIDVRAVFADTYGGYRRYWRS